MPAMLLLVAAIRERIAGMARSYMGTSRGAGMAPAPAGSWRSHGYGASPTMFNIHWVHCRHRGSRGNA